MTRDRTDDVDARQGMNGMSGHAMTEAPMDDATLRQVTAARPDASTTGR